MKKLRNVLLLLTFVFTLAIGMNVSAASSKPYIFAEDYTIDAKVGDDVDLKLKYYRSGYIGDKVVTNTYTLFTDEKVATSSHIFYHYETASTVNYTVTWDTDDVAPGNYKTICEVYYFSNSTWHLSSYITIYINLTCEHSYTSKITKAATCTADGVRTYTCSVCGDSYTEAVPAIGTHSYKQTDSEAATCTDAGWKLYTCSVCGDSYTKDIPATGKHSYKTPTFKWSSTGKTATAVFTCKSGGETKSVKATVTSTKSTSTIKYTAKAIFNGKTYSATKSVKRTSIDKNETFTSGNLTYKVTSVSGKSGTASVTKAKSTTLTSVKVPDTVKVNGVTLKITSIADNAFKDMKKLQTVTAGANVTKIGANAFSGCTALTTFKSTASKLSTIGAKAFYGCKKLTTVSLKTTKLTKDKVGSSAFKGIKATCTFKVPASKVTSYKSIFVAKGSGKKITVKSL